MRDHYTDLYYIMNIMGTPWMYCEHVEGDAKHTLFRGKNLAMERVDVNQGRSECDSEKYSSAYDWNGG